MGDYSVFDHDNEPEVEELASMGETKLTELLREAYRRLSNQMRTYGPEYRPGQQRFREWSYRRDIEVLTQALGSLTPSDADSSDTDADSSDTDSIDGPAPVEHQIAIFWPNKELLEWVRHDPRRLMQVGPQGLEDLVLELLESFGFSAASIGKANRPDGGVDIIARRCDPVDYLMAVQIESHETRKKLTKPAKARELAGVVNAGPFNFGLLVTNTGFTSNALQFLDELSKYLRRVAYPELCQWLVGNLVMEPTSESRLPSAIKIPSGPTVKIPQSSILDRWGRPFSR